MKKILIAFTIFIVSNQFASKMPELPLTPPEQTKLDMLIEAAKTKSSTEVLALLEKESSKLKNLFSRRDKSGKSLADYIIVMPDYSKIEDNLSQLITTLGINIDFSTSLKLEVNEALKNADKTIRQSMSFGEPYIRSNIVQEMGYMAEVSNRLNNFLNSVNKNADKYASSKDVTNMYKKVIYIKGLLNALYNLAEEED